MKKKIKIVEHGKQWIDPDPSPVILCPECGSEKLKISETNYDNCYKNFLIVYLDREGFCRKCKDCGCIFEIGSKVSVRTRPVWIAFTIFLISLIVMIILILSICDYEEAERVSAPLVLGLSASIVSTIISLSCWIALL